MTKEELKQEAEEYLKKHNYTSGYIGYFASGYCKQAYIDSAEPREKRIAELEEENKVLAQNLEDTEIVNKALEKENAELKKVAEFQQSSNMSRHFENKKLKEGLAVGSTFNKALNSMNKSLEEERDKYREMTFDMKDQLTKAKELLKQWLQTSKASSCDNINIVTDTEQFLSEVENDRNN